MARWARVSIRIAALLAASAAACTSILGDFEPGGGDATGASGGGGGGGGAVASLVLAPTSDLVRVLRGGSAVLGVTVARSGPVGDVTLVLAGLPVGVTAEPVLVPASQSSGELLVQATTAAPHGAVVASLGDAAALATPVDVPLLVADAPGTLDASFDSDGALSVVPAGGTAGATALRVVPQPNGAIVVGGTLAANSGWAVRRFGPGGAPDTAFDAAAVVGMPTTGQLHGLALDVASGKIVAVGASSSQLTVVRLNADGTPDDAFGSGGVLRTTSVTYPQGSEGWGVAVQADGKMLVAGTDTSPTPVGIVLRLETNGALDASFAGGTFHDRDDTRLEAVLVDPDGLVVAAGQDLVSSPPRFWVTRLTSAGAPDASFGTAGSVSFGSGYHFTHEIVRLPSGDLVVCGEDHISQSDASLGRLTALGVPVWPSGGDIAYDIFGPTNRAWGCAAPEDGTIVFAGFGFGSVEHEGYVVRVDGAGVADPTFGDLGTVAFVPPGGPPPKYSLYDVALLPDGRIVAVGNKDDAGWFVTRLFD
ncbi:MAG: hypothetical protein HY908_15060 [Myxococcales bacterium]|nr:hypothetical protein [Myxococcales bacterium]